MVVAGIGYLVVFGIAAKAAFSILPLIVTIPLLIAISPPAVIVLSLSADDKRHFWKIYLAVWITLFISAIWIFS